MGRREGGGSEWKNVKSGVASFMSMSIKQQMAFNYIEIKLPKVPTNISTFPGPHLALHSPYHHMP